MAILQPRVKGTTDVEEFRHSDEAKDLLTKDDQAEVDKESDISQKRMREAECIKQAVARLRVLVQAKQAAVAKANGRAVAGENPAGRCVPRSGVSRRRPAPRYSMGRGTGESHAPAHLSGLVRPEQPTMVGYLFSAIQGRSRLTAITRRRCCACNWHGKLGAAKASGRRARSKASSPISIQPNYTCNRGWQSRLSNARHPL